VQFGLAERFLRSGKGPKKTLMLSSMVVEKYENAFVVTRSWWTVCGRFLVT
jgi:hypothetical protein